MPQIPFTGGKFSSGGAVLPQYREWVNQRYIPASQSPSSAFWNSMTRAYVPGGPWAADLPQAGYAGGTLGRIAGGIPWAGGAIRSGLAAMRANQATGEGWMVQPREESGLSRGMAGAASIAQYIPGGGIMGVLKNILAGARGVMGAPETFGTTWGEMAAGTGGGMIRNLADRTGIIKAGGFSPWGTGGGMRWDRSGMGGGESYNPLSPTENPRAFPDVKWALDPNLNPGGFPAPGFTPATQEQMQNPFYNPDTGNIPSWAQ